MNVFQQIFNCLSKAQQEAAAKSMGLSMPAYYARLGKVPLTKKGN
jgi:hypothetical protein